jgi:transcriptional regulator of acetoin/glycerol metabolism
MCGNGTKDPVESKDGNQNDNDDCSNSCTNGCGKLKDIEREAVKEAILGCNGNKSKAAGMLGISRKAFYKCLSENGA